MKGTPLTANQIPCCICGTMIFSNAANQCATCLSQDQNLTDRLQRGPAGAPYSTIHQCRKCRRFARTEKHYEHADPESPELLALVLKHIPGLQDVNMKLVDANWIWTEPHSMRLKVQLTVRTEMLQVVVQQRVKVELHIQFKMCPECNREYTNRTWQALVQVRQHRESQGGASKSGLAALEIALARNDQVRKHVIKIDAAKNGFDFYFLSAVHSQAFTQFLQRVAPMRIKTSSKLVSSDVRNNTSNTKTTTVATMVPLCRGDLLLIHKRVGKGGGKLAGRWALVNKVSSVIHLVDAAPKRENLEDSLLTLSPDAYYKEQKNYSVLQEARRLSRFVVLDVELCDGDVGGVDGLLYRGPKSGVDNYALADVEVVREADFGVNDETMSCVTHLGHLLKPGDVALGYDIASSIGSSEDWELQESFHSGFVQPDVVLVKKCKGNEKQEKVEEDPEDEGSGTKKKMTKRRERKRRLREGKKSKELEESAVRMGFFHEENEFNKELENDPEMAAELRELEREFEMLGNGGVNGSPVVELDDQGEA